MKPERRQYVTNIRVAGPKPVYADLVQPGGEREHGKKPREEMIAGSRSIKQRNRVLSQRRRRDQPSAQVRSGSSSTRDK
jgi:hypothetical protein